MNILSSIWRALTLIKNAIGNIVFLVVVIVILFAVLSTDSISIENNTALILNPAGTVVEQRSLTNPLDDLVSPERVSETVLREILLAISTAKSDDQITALVLDLSNLGSISMGHLEEIGNALNDFKTSNKPVLAFGPSYSQAQYLIAAHADRIVLDKNSLTPLGGVFLTGFGVYPLYYRSALETLKVDIEVFSAGDYKDAAEPYTLDGMSEYSREANAAWLTTLWDRYENIVTTQRGISNESFYRYTNEYNELLAQAGNDAALLSVNEGYTDELLSNSAWQEEMISIVGRSGHSFRQIGFQDYLRATQPPIQVPNPSRDKIAVITASGTILDGEQPSGVIGGESLSSLIRTARRDDKIKGVVLRINSPGGSAAASEKIRRELTLLQQDGKPVVVSMSSYAASGGYWISSTANKIFALESTVTGSIGTFILFPTFEKSLAELGVHTDGVGTTALSGALSPFKAISPVIQDTLERSVDRTYRKFVSLVADGRDMTLAEVEEIAKGRVWAGKTALELGLVDAIGGLEDAISSAAHLSDVSEYEVIYIEQELSTRERLIKELLNVSTNTIAQVYPAREIIDSLLPKEFLDLISMSKTPGLYLHCFYCQVR